MQGSSFSLAELVITYLGTTDTSLPRELRTTVPNPLPFGEDATFGVVFVNGGDEVDLTQLDIEVPGGYDLTHNRGRGAELFADAPIQVLTGPVEGEWRRIDAKHLRWFGNETVPANGALDWTIRVRITDDASQLTAYEPYALPHASLTFENGFEINGTRWGPSPGIIRLRVPPDDLETIGVVDGYPHALPGEYAINGSLGSATARLYGDGTYTVTPASQDLVRLDSSVANSSLRVNERLVPLGEIVRVEASLESLLSLAAQQGAAEVNLSFELYPPPMIGCAPVKTWTRTLRSLGQESATLTMMWDGGTGAGGSFAALPSSRVAKFDFKGDRVWASQLSGEVLAWTKVPDASPTPALVVGLSSGEVCSVGALLGEVRWCQSVGDEVRAAYARDQEILAGSSDGALVMLTPAGDIIRTGAALAPVRAIEPLGAGWGVLTDDGLERFDAGLSRTALAAAPAPLAFAEGSGAVRVAYSGGVLVLGEADLAVVERFDYPTPAVAAGGDVDGDGVMDLAIASDRGHVVLHGGVSGKAWETDASTAILPDNPPHTMEIDGFDFTVNPVGSVSDAIEKYCRPKSISGYGDAEICSFPEVVTSKQLSIGQGRVYHRFDFAADEKITAYDADGVGATIDVPAANHHDAGLLAGRRVVQAADVEGNLTLVDVETGVVVYQKAASDLGSTIGASFRIPAGGFFGSHLIIAKLTWPVEGTQQEARLLDWFEVVASDGSPVTKPAYRAVLIVKDRGG